MAIFRVIGDIRKDMDFESEQYRNAMKNALQIAGYRHMRHLRDELALGRLGLAKLKQYRRNPALSSGSGAPLWQLYPGVMYGRNASQPMRVALGFLAFDTEFKKRTNNLQKWAKAIAEKHLTGYRFVYTTYRRKQMIRGGIYLRKTTTGADVPARDIIAAYYQRNESQIFRDIAQYFNRKFSGERI